jgi:predicted anti-sigma-YlaC factor YlaD
MNRRGIADLFPWYLNGTLGGHERQRVEEHIQECSTCRDELAKERRIYEEMAVEPSVEYMPAASLKRLQAAISSLDSEHTPSRPARVRRLLSWTGLAAASILLAAVAVAFVTADRWGHSREPEYHTVTTSIARPQDEVIRAVFAPTITLVDLQGILTEAQLRIVSGPTEAGVYSLAATSHRSVSASLALLRNRPEVRFAESTQRGQPADSRDALPRESP